jgi:hypothetical protein
MRAYAALKLTFAARLFPLLERDVNPHSPLTIRSRGRADEAREVASVRPFSAGEINVGQVAGPTRGTSSLAQPEPRARAWR